MISGHQMWDSSVYPNAQEFDGSRFLKMRDQADKGCAAQLVSTSPEHLGFGYGKAACPGRFFAAKELKIALCHILTRYDMKLTTGSEPRAFTHGFFFVADPVAKIAIKRRRPEEELC
jgi:cytochrome P450